jgi:hypothetical protein
VLHEDYVEFVVEEVELQYFSLTYLVLVANEVH